MNGYVYILRSLKNGRFYIGSTIDVNQRIYRHNQGLVASTKNSRPYKIELIQKYETLIQAKRIEYRIKKLKRKDYVEKMILDQCIHMGP